MADNDRDKIFAQLQDKFLEHAYKVRPKEDLREIVLAIGHIVIDDVIGLIHGYSEECLKPEEVKEFAKNGKFGSAETTATCFGLMAHPNEIKKMGFDIGGIQNLVKDKQFDAAIGKYHAMIIKSFDVPLVTFSDKGASSSEMVIKVPIRAHDNFLRLFVQKGVGGDGTLITIPQFLNIVKNLVGQLISIEELDQATITRKFKVIDFKRVIKLEGQAHIQSTHHVYKFTLIWSIVINTIY